MSIFSKPDMPPAPPPPPTVADFATQEAKAGAARAAGAAQGDSDTIKTSGQGVLTPANTTKKSVLG